jgi:hypothetical protein
VKSSVKYLTLRAMNTNVTVAWEFAGPEGETEADFDLPVGETTAEVEVGRAIAY